MHLQFLLPIFQQILIHQKKQRITLSLKNTYLDHFFFSFRLMKSQYMN